MAFIVSLMSLGQVRTFGQFEQIREAGFVGQIHLAARLVIGLADLEPDLVRQGKLIRRKLKLIDC